MLSFSACARGRGLACVLALASLSLPGWALPTSSAPLGDPPNGAGELPARQPNAEAQMRLATGLKNAARGLEGAELRSARARAVAAYRAVCAHFPDDADFGAEARFRAAELLRADGESAAALEEFRLAASQPGNASFRWRARLEIAHLERRAKHADAALASYEALLSDASVPQRGRDDACLWIGVVQHERGREEDARRAWQRVADGAEDVLDRVRAWDRLALSFLEVGDLEGAAGQLDRCRLALADAAAEETRMGERVRSALAHMRAVEELQRAIEKQHDARADDARTSKSGDVGARRDAKKNP